MSKRKGLTRGNSALPGGELVGDESRPARTKRSYPGDRKLSNYNAILERGNKRK